MSATSFEAFPTPQPSEYSSGVITRLDLVTTKDVILLDAISQTHYLPNARLLTIGGRCYRFGPRNNFDLIYFMKTHALGSATYQRDIDIPFCNPIITPRTKILRSFQINNFVFVIKLTDDTPLQQIIVATPAERFRIMTRMKLEIYEILAQITPERVHYSAHSHGYVQLTMVPQMNRAVTKLQYFLRRGMFMRRCFYRSALLALCMATHGRLGTGSSPALIRLMEDPKDGLMRTMIAPLLLSRVRV